MHARTPIVVAALAIGIAAQPAARQQARDPVRRAPVGTAVVSGIVTTDDASPGPVRRARVSLVTSDFTSVSATTDDAGRFVITGVPAGTYRAQASKPAWLQAEYGASKPGRAGTPIVVRDGDRVQNIAIRLGRGAVVSGTVTGRAGQSLAGVEVRLLRRSLSALTGEPQYGLSSANAMTTTDDEGNYRVFGLTAGSYVVVAMFRSGPAASLMDLDRQTAEDVARITAAPTSGATAPNPAPRTLEGFAPVYFPGTADAARAVEFRLAAGEERAGTNLVLEPVLTATVSVIAALPEGADPSSLQVSLLAESPLAANVGSNLRPIRQPDGRYVFQGLTPGGYTLQARAGSSRESLTHYANANLAIDGRDQTVPLELAPGMTVSGQAVFEGDSTLARDLDVVSVLLVASNSPGGLTGPRGSFDKSGAFSIPGVPAGRYRLAFLAGASRQGWHLKSVHAATVDVMEEGLVVSPGADVSLTLSYTSAPSELKGKLQTASGRPALEYTLIVFSEDRRYWRPLSTRVRSVKPSSDSTYSFMNLPAGEYWLAAVSDIDPAQPLDAETLAQLMPAAVQVRIMDATTTIQDLKIK